MQTASIRLHAPPASARLSETEFEALATGEAQDSAETRTPVAPEQPSEPSEVETELTRLREAQAQVQSLAEGLAHATEKLHNAAAEADESTSTFAIELAVGIAQEILRSEINAGNYPIETIVRSTLAVSETGRSACTVHLHPDDLESIDVSRFRSNTEFESDPDIARGDVHVTTLQGLLVRDIDDTLARVRTELLEARK